MSLTSISQRPALSDQVVHWRGHEFSMRRLDQMSIDAPGNKWFKLRLNLERALQQPSRALLTFGGPFSNHLLATARSCRPLGLRSIGLVRGGEVETPVMVACRAAGMTLVPITRAEYREKTDSDFLNGLRAQWNNPWIVPEGGANTLGVHGAQGVLQREDLDRFDVVAVAVGTGTTLAGMAIKSQGRLPIVGISALKGVDHRKEIHAHLIRTVGDLEMASELLANVSIWGDAHEGGFGKTSPKLLTFMQEFAVQTGVPLDRVYNGKLMMRLDREWLKPKTSQDPLVRHGKRILIIHTGGTDPAANRFSVDDGQSSDLPLRP